MAYSGIFLTGIFLPVTLFYIYFSKKQKDKEFKKRWGSLYEFQKVNSLSQRLYNLVYILRRCIFMAMSMFFIKNVNGFITLISFAILNQLFQIFIVNTKPYKKRILNRIEIFNEMFIQFSIYFMICYSNWIPDQNLQY